MMLNIVRYEWNIYRIVIFAALVVVVAVSTTCRRSPDSRQSESWESRIFSKYVLETIPKSVTDIKVDELEFPVLGHGYVMRFKIEKADMTHILNSQAFEEFTSVVYKQGGLFWRNIDDRTRDPVKDLLGGDTSNLPLYTNQRQQQPPEWFRPNDWSNPKVYAVSEKYGKSSRYQTKVLIYNEKLEEAYFVEYLQGH